MAAAPTIFSMNALTVSMYLSVRILSTGGSGFLNDMGPMKSLCKSGSKIRMHAGGFIILIILTAYGALRKTIIFV